MNPNGRHGKLNLNECVIVRGSTCTAGTLNIYSRNAEIRSASVIKLLEFVRRKMFMKILHVEIIVLTVNVFMVIYSRLPINLWTERSLSLQE